MIPKEKKKEKEDEEEEEEEEEQEEEEEEKEEPSLCGEMLELDSYVPIKVYGHSQVYMAFMHTGAHKHREAAPNR